MKWSRFIAIAITALMIGVVFASVATVALTPDGSMIRDMPRNKPSGAGGGNGHGGGNGGGDNGGSGGDSSSGAGDGIVNRYAIVVGISDYKAVNDLSYCDEDATDWYNYLHGLGYTIWLYGDSSSSYPKYDGLATEYNVKKAIANVISMADADDIIVFASSGHGGSSGKVTYLCMWDCGAGENGEDGYFTDAEFAQAWADAKAKVFIFLDHCNSGGMDDITKNANFVNFYMTTTCGPHGYGYDMPEYQNGKWTYWFLEKGLVEKGFTTMEECYDWAVAQYGASGQDQPREFDGDHSVSFTL